MKKNDAVGLSELFENSYPFKVLLDNPEKGYDSTIEIVIKNKKSFLRYYPGIFNLRMQNLIEQVPIGALTLMEGGIKFNKGELWFLYYRKQKKVKMMHILNYNKLFRSILSNPKL